MNAVTSCKTPDALLAPDVPLTPFVFERAQLLGDRPAVLDGISAHHVTYGQLVSAIRLVAASLARNGFEQGDECAIVAPNVPEYVEALHAVALLGGAARLVDPDLAPASLPDALASARVVVATPEVLAAVRAAGGQPLAREVFVFGEGRGATLFTELYKSTGYVPGGRIASGDNAVVFCSDGQTTQRFTHQSLVEAICRLEASETIGEGEVVVSTVPFWHTYGASAILGLGLHRGARVVTLPPRVEPAALVAAVRRYGATRVYLASRNAQHATVCAERLGCTLRPGDPGFEGWATMVVSGC